MPGRHSFAATWLDQLKIKAATTAIATGIGVTTLTFQVPVDCQSEHSVHAKICIQARVTLFLPALLYAKLRAFKLEIVRLFHFLGTYTRGKLNKCHCRLAGITVKNASRIYWLPTSIFLALATTILCMETSR